MRTAGAVNILLVDDQPARLTSYEVILESLGQNLVRALSGREALELLEKDEFAVVLLDVSMPVLDGFETAALIQELPLARRPPIIFVTGFRVADLDRLRGYDLGAVDYVYVPILPDILRSKVAVFVELHQKRRELEELNRSLAAANARLAVAHDSLQAEKARELLELNRTLERSNAELASANRALEAEVQERTRLESSLMETDRRKDELLTMLAHELRNPLAPIVSAVEIMRGKHFDDPELILCRDVMQRQSRNLARLVEDLLDISRITQGKIRMEMVPIDISSVVERAIGTTRPLLAAKRHELTVEHPGRAILVLADPTRLAQAIGNLLTNAANKTEEGGRIRVVVEEARRPDGAAGVAVRVKDNGAGIEREDLPRTFELFARGPGTPEHAHGGLGLALAARLIEIHGGTVTADSEGPGRGSEFVIRLPELSETAAEAAQPGAAGSPHAQRVLVVDDNVDAARSLAVLLEAAGSVVEIAFDGTQAVQAAEEFRPDVVLLDLGMPKLDGYGAARWIRAQPWARNVMIIALTGWGQEDVRAGVREAGFDAHMVKPVDFAALAARFAELPTGHRGGLVAH